MSYIHVYAVKNMSILLTLAYTKSTHPTALVATHLCKLAEETWTTATSYGSRSNRNFDQEWESAVFDENRRRRQKWRLRGIGQCGRGWRIIAEGKERACWSWDETLEAGKRIRTRNDIHGGRRCCVCPGRQSSTISRFPIPRPTGSCRINFSAMPAMPC